VEYHDGQVKRIDSVVIGAQHDAGISQDKIRKDVIEHVIKPVISAALLDQGTNYFVNATGTFELGGPVSDTGFTGRKLLVDTYGGMARHGGGSFSGKDPTKVDRSAAYMARYIAKNMVAAGLAERLEIQVSYVIGVAHPLSVSLEAFGTEKVCQEKLDELVKKHFDLRPAAIIKTLDLRRPIYRQTAAYGHFGRIDIDLPWEKTDKAEILRKEGFGK
jgi:S-adenosylmethionine synthetase